MLKTFTMFIRGQECLITGHINESASAGASFAIEGIYLLDSSARVAPHWHGDPDTYDVDPEIDRLDDGELLEIETAFWDLQAPAGIPVVVQAEGEPSC